MWAVVLNVRRSSPMDTYLLAFCDTEGLSETVLSVCTVQCEPLVLVSGKQARAMMVGASVERATGWPISMQGLS